MSLNAIGHLLRETGRSLTKNAWMALASVSTVTIALFVLAVFVVVSANVNHVTQLLENQVEMRVFIKPHVSRQQEMALYREAKAWPQVRRIDYFTKQQAADNLKSEFPDQQDLFQVIQKSNPLFDGFDIYTKTPRQIPVVASRMSKDPIVHNVVYQGTVVRRLTRLGNILKWSGWVVEALLAIATMLIIVNTIRLAVFARRREIQVMRLVGATDWFIRWPFILEGLTIGLIGAVVSDMVIGSGYRWVIKRAATSLPFWPMAGWHQVMAQTTLFTVAGGLIVGGLASLIAVRRFLKI
ncbi:permease-like cell division protein FtsX [Sulfobacillus harzensis]|uniref:Cell division protein FtsX n=1 Tax=Sulfobacillus harzensis TaxID=2729629 RepID=A0A7Y0L673_9FIRM|nr:permease-like cell division protein FtsX [Sulfobacillus harzensis]NMP22659.1 ABC transporter permease [Sulfobacillus harzensis]